ncbi:hypothetical protein [Schlesneria paludicola]|uniref:hypothetical protein n=1 Tax=Schlesneria paludicola TaxID=360056 RepID=UPI00031ED624|nr:hypothetical protein [Schlesneria paludicola]
MARSRLVIAVAICVGFGLPGHLRAQQIYTGITPTGPGESVRVIDGRFGVNGQVGGPPMAYPPRTVYVDGVYPSRTILNQATRGSVIEYTHNGNGSISTPGSSYQTVISSGPPIFPVTTVVQPAEPPVIIDSRPISRMGQTVDAANNRARVPGADRLGTSIQLLLPTADGVPFSYVLNGTRYSIKSGYVHSFADDRDWIIEFASDGYRRPLTRYRLRAGTYQFARDVSGWDLKMLPVVSPIDIPPRPLPVEKPVAAPAPSPGL